MKLERKRIKVSSNQKRIAFVVSSKSGDELTGGKGDASSIYYILTKPEYGACDPKISQIVPECKSLREFEDKLRLILTNWNPRDQLIFYFSGHGHLYRSLYCLFFGEEQSENIPFQNLLNIIVTGGVNKAIIIIDACYSGAAIPSGIKSTDDQLTNLELLEHHRGIVLLTSSTRIQPSEEFEDGTGSVFTKLLYDAIDSGLGGHVTVNAKIYIEDVVTYINNILETDSKYGKYLQRATWKTLNQLERRIWLAHNKTEAGGKGQEGGNLIHSGPELDKLYERYAGDNTPVENVNHEHIDWSLVEEFAERHFSDPILIPSNRNMLLDSLGFYLPIRILNKRVLSRAVVLCFTKLPQTYLHNSSALFFQVNERYELIQREPIMGPLKQQILQLGEILRRQLEPTISFDDKGNRINFIEEDMSLFRELIANAIIHRDYDLSASTTITIHPDYVEIKNPGNFPETLSWELLLEYSEQGDNSSLPPNQSISYFMQQLVLHEKAGRGFRVIRNYLEKYGNKAIEYRALSDPAVRIRVKRRGNTLELKNVKSTFMNYLVERYQNFDFKGMGVDRVIALPLLEMYVPLKARMELPKGETWDRSRLRLGGWELPEDVQQRLGEQQPVLDLLQEFDGLVILGDPGAGKTTFLKYLAVRLALGEGKSLGIGDRLPILLPLSAYARALNEGDITLDDFISHYYGEQGIDLPLKPLFEETLRRGGVLFLLDGLDEVQSVQRRGLVADRFLTYFTFHRPAGNKFVLTSRIIGYDDVRPVHEKLKECTLVDLDRSEMEAFVHKWTAALEKAARGGHTAFGSSEAQRERKELLEAIDRHEGVRRLATNPLLLTILALMKRQGVSLPERRIELYDKYIETLIQHWNLARGLDSRGARQLDYGTTVQVLAGLALWMHQDNPGISIAPQEAVKRQLMAIYRRRGVADPEKQAEKLLFDAREHAGLLVERGERGYGFIHLTFQEYLAAIGIAQQEDEGLESVVQMLASYLGDGNWYEVLLLALAYIGIIQQREKAATRILRQLIERAPGEPGQAVILAGQAVGDMSPGGVTPQFRDDIADELVQIMRASHVNLQKRAEAGRVLGQLAGPDGTLLDPRPGVGFIIQNKQKIPDIVWGGEVPAGTYTVGGDSKAYRSFDMREVVIEQNYCLSRYPITYAQFQCFLEAADFHDERWWAGMPAEEEAYGRRFQLRELSEQSFPFGNHPRENVSWYQAVAFCRWLTNKLDIDVDLPHEYEWEVAARYPDSRTYPWKDGFAQDRLNTREGGIDKTIAVGMFHNGRNEIMEVYDMSGNVWEWCRNKYGNPEDDAVDRSVHARVLHGGSWFYDANLARAATRLSGQPGNRDLDVGFRLLRRSTSPLSDNRQHIMEN